jgi:hypothetical protein
MARPRLFSFSQWELNEKKKPRYIKKSKTENGNVPGKNTRAMREKNETSYMRYLEYKKNQIRRK